MPFILRCQAARFVHMAVKPLMLVDTYHVICNTAFMVAPKLMQVNSKLNNIYNINKVIKFDKIITNPPYNERAAFELFND